MKNEPYNTPNPNPLERLRGREPYKIPDGFFNVLETDVLSRIKAEESRNHKRNLSQRIKVAIWSIASTAAIALLAVNVAPGLWHTQPAPDRLTAEQAFDSLSESDQEYLLDNYTTDMAMYYANL